MMKASDLLIPLLLFAAGVACLTAVICTAITESTRPERSWSVPE